MCKVTIRSDRAIDGTIGVVSPVLLEIGLR
jgi:hypothetical protein